MTRIGAFNLACPMRECSAIDRRRVSYGAHSSGTVVGTQAPDRPLGGGESDRGIEGVLTMWGA